MTNDRRRGIFWGVLITVLVFVLLGARLDRNTEQIGRYQMANAGRGNVYVIDTATGEITSMFINDPLGRDLGAVIDREELEWAFSQDDR